MRVLLLDEHDDIASVADALSAHGHELNRCHRSADALCAHRDADLLLVDLGLGEPVVFELLRRLRRISALPVLALTDRGDARSALRLLRCGADDFVVKPIRVRELLTRIETATQRAELRAEPAQPVVEVKDVSIDLDARTVQAGGESVALTTKEFEVLAVLARKVGIAVSRERIMDEVWGDAYLAISRALDVHLATLRTKLARPGLVHTIRGFGYRLG